MAADITPKKPVKAKSSPRTCVACGNILIASVYYTASSSILQKLQHILNDGNPQPPPQAAPGAAQLVSLQLSVAESDKQVHLQEMPSYN